MAKQFGVHTHDGEDIWCASWAVANDAANFNGWYVITRELP